MLLTQELSSSGREGVQQRREHSGVQHCLIGNSPAIKSAIRDCQRFADTRCSVLLTGPNGSGKRHAARLIHALSSEGDSPLPTAYCAGLQLERLDSLLRQSPARALLLCDVDRASDEVQVRLLELLESVSQSGHENGQMTSHRAWRILATSSCDLASQVQLGKFREDLFWLLNIAHIGLPPLSQRREDIPLLIEHFVRRWQKCGQPNSDHCLTPSEMDKLLNHSWPGNVRQLQCCIQRAMALGRLGQADWGWLLQHFSVPPSPSESRHDLVAAAEPPDIESLTYALVKHGVLRADQEQELLHEYVVNRVERELIAQVLTECGNVQTKAAHRLGINRNTLRTKVKDYNLEILEQPSNSPEYK
ncbi:MAG: sigma-54-dependent Fis family transcriptional regulator [Pirellulaceae bacterium]|nr:sigma-54-dependent Fis family transcriptional regulator [Pirellulaceae bacterium]